MKPLLVVCSLLLSTVSVTVSFAQGQIDLLAESPQRVFPDDDGPLSEPRRIALGLTPDAVINAMKGRPDAMLAPDLWVYEGFRVGGDAGTQKFDTLVVFFSRGRVFKFRFVERRALAALMGELRKSEKPGPAIAAK